jgi:hypothetical protein
MDGDEMLTCKSDVEDVVRSAFPIEGDRFCLYAPSKTVEETGGAFCLVLDAMVYAQVEEGATRKVESIREESVELVPRAAMPIARERLENYLVAVERCVGEQDFEALEELPPSTWFPVDLLEIPTLVSVDDFQRFIAARLPTPKAKVRSGPALAMVLLDEPHLPNAEAIRRAYADMAHDGAKLVPEEGSDDVITFSLGEASLFVTLIPVAVPNREADAVASFSVARRLGASTESHQAHLLVALGVDGRPVDRLTMLLRCAAAVASAAAKHALGVYLGQAGVTHPPAFFIEQAGSPLPMELLCGVSIASRDDSAQLLSRGMQQFGLPDLLLTTCRPTVDAGVAEFFFTLLALLVRRGRALPAGDTVGRDANERLHVRYAPSPVDPRTPVWRVDLPA